VIDIITVIKIRELLFIPYNFRFTFFDFFISEDFYSMGMMARMRSLAPWFIITVGGLFVLFMVISDSKVLENFGQRSNDVGSIGGERITYEEFSNFVETARQNQMQSTGQEIDESQMDRFRDQVWDAIVTQKLLENKIREFGIEVSDQEVRDKILGDNPPEFLRRSFIDSVGNFNKQMYEQAIFDPKNKEILVQAEEAVKQQLIQEKLQNMIEGTILVSPAEVKRSYLERNTTITAEYALVESVVLKDDDIKYDDGDLKDFYQEKIDDYKIEPQRKVKYVVFKREASKDDTLNIINTLTGVKGDFARDSSDFKFYVDTFSDQPYSQDTVGFSLIPESAWDLIAGANTGSLVGPVITPAGYVLYRVTGQVSGSDEIVRASHILIEMNGPESVVKATADSLYEAIKSGQIGFEEAAKTRSADPGSAKKGGDLGWFGRGQMVPEFEKASFEGKVGEVQKPVQSSFGFHIVKVTGKSDKKYILEKIVRKIEPSATTIDKIYNDANDFAYLADKYEYESEAVNLKYQVLESAPFKEDATSVPGLGASKALIEFAFNNDPGDVSKVFKVPSGYTVVTVSEIIKAGFKPFDEVKDQVKIAYIREMKKKKALTIATDVRKKLGNKTDLNEAKNLSPNVRLAQANKFTPSGNVPTVGRDYAFINYALNGDINKISEPVTGIKGAYLIKVTERTPFDSSKFAMQKNLLRDQMLQQKKAQAYQQWLESLKKEVEIIDNRHLFYR